MNEFVARAIAGLPAVLWIGSIGASSHREAFHAARDARGRAGDILR